MIIQKNNATVTVFIFLFVILHIPLLLQPVGHTHAWRQSDTAAVSRNFYEESFNIFYPRVDIRGDLSGITGMEFPLYQYLSGLLYFIFDTNSDVPGKLISLVCAIAVLLLLLALAGNIDKKITTSSIAIVYLTSPFIFMYSTAFMPEIFALCLSLVGIYYFSRYEEIASIKYLAPSVLFFCLASLSRPFLIFLCYPFVERFIVDVKKRRLTWGVILGGLIVVVFFSGWYFLWAPYLIKRFGLNCFFFGSGFFDNMKGMLSLHFWALLFDEITQAYLGWIWLPFTLHGAYILIKNGNRLYRYFLMSSLIGIVVLGLRAGTHFSPHYYYLIFTMPFLVYSSSYSLTLLLSKAKVNVMALGVVLIVLLAMNKIRMYREDKNAMSIKDTVREIQQRTARNELVAVEDNGGYAYSLHLIRRKGWVLSKEQIRKHDVIVELHKKGAVWVIPCEGGKSVLYPIQDWQDHISE